MCLILIYCCLIELNLAGDVECHPIFLPSLKPLVEIISIR